MSIPTVTQAKQQAKRLRAELAELGETIPHSEALERVSKQHGFRDWNSFSAVIGNRYPENWQLGGQISGHYLGHPFKATVIQVEAMRPGWFRLVLDLHEAIDVVAFDSFSNIRKRIRGEVGPEGTSKEQTSDGRPHLAIDM